MSERKKSEIYSIFGAANLPAIDANIASVVTNPGISHWLRKALSEAVNRDPLDALNDAKMLVELLELRCNAALMTMGISYGSRTLCDSPSIEGKTGEPARRADERRARLSRPVGSDPDGWID